VRTRGHCRVLRGAPRSPHDEPARAFLAQRRAFPSKEFPVLDDAQPLGCRTATRVLVIALLGCAAPLHAQRPEALPVTPPEVLRRVNAEYPPAALASRLEATVVLTTTIGLEGTVTDVLVLESGGEAFDAAAVVAVKQWRFLPAHAGAENVVSRIRIPFRFALPPVEAHPVPAAPPDAGASRSQPGDAGVEEEVIDVTVRGKRRPPSRGVSDYQLDVGGLATVPRANAAELLKLAPGILLTNEGGEGHAEQVFLRGFDAREGQDIEFSVDGVPINQSGNLHGNGYTDTHFIIPEVVDSLRVVEGPFDPRQGNFAVAGSAEYHLGLAARGLTAKVGAGSFGTYRGLVTWAPPGSSDGTFLAGELYQTDGFGSNRDGRRGTVLAQLEGQLGSSRYRVTGGAYLASFHTAGVLREDDFDAGRVGFFGTYDPLQGEDTTRFSLAAELESRVGAVLARNQLFAIVNTLRLRENFTGVLLDVQEPQQDPHAQRGDLLDLHNSATTVGLRGSAHWATTVFDQPQELELGYFGRVDFVSAMQQRLEAATGHPYHTDTDLDSTLGDVGLYVDANLHFLSWLSLRGGVRADLFTFDVNNLCAVQSVEHPSTTNPPGDQSCLSQQNFGAYRDPNQRVTTSSAAAMPRGSILVEPFVGLTASLSAGQGVRSIDPNYIAQDAKTPFASISSYEAGLTFQRRLGEVDVGVRTALFDTRVDKDLIFSQTAGRNVLAGATTRFGSANSARLTGRFFDVSGNLTWVRATFDDTHELIPYVPDLVARLDGAVFAELPWWKPGGHALKASASTGVTFVAPRPLPYGTRSDAIFTIDANVTLGWRFVELGLSAQNLLNTQYRLGEYNYASDFHSQAFPTLVPVRHFSAGAPRTLFLTLALTFGGGR
jgi:TonB family protein